MNKHEVKEIKLLHVGAVKALKAAVKKAIAEHKSAGVPAAIWRDGKVVHLSGGQSRGRRGR